MDEIVLTRSFSCSAGAVRLMSVCCSLRLQVFVAAFGFDVADNATTEDLVAQLQTLQAPNTTTLDTIVTKIQKACADANLPVVVSVDAIQQSLKSKIARCLT